MARPALHHSGFALSMVEMASQLVFIALFYELLKPVNKPLSLVAAFLGLAGCVIKAFARIFYLTPLFILGGGSKSAFGHAQRRLWPSCRSA